MLLKPRYRPVDNYAILPNRVYNFYKRQRRGDCILGVEKGVKQGLSMAAKAVAQAHGVPPILADILVNMVMPSDSEVPNKKSAIPEEDANKYDSALSASDDSSPTQSVEAQNEFKPTSYGGPG